MFGWMQKALKKGGNCVAMCFPPRHHESLLWRSWTFQCMFPKTKMNSRKDQPERNGRAGEELNLTTTLALTPDPTSGGKG